ncbi:hypothetical protein RHIZ_07135 [Rhizobium skierniewicense]|uniref:hypothetical protein n=1 Tax=Rhizobium skierniewicense TaxID=984260 RepID=UPI001FAC056D|nr:hypothetical protein [Rhizobium skierniewicense]MCI9865715.1 hypothetical protein [Rhizobium skierniewicense]
MANEITISTNESEIRSMMIRLMGRGMTLSQKVEGHFLINYADLEDLINKIMQRVHLQNKNEMTDFYAEFQFTDGARDTVPSYQHFKQYRCLNSKLCNKGKLTFAFLINFGERGAEKQSVDIEFSGMRSGYPLIFDLIDVDANLGAVKIKIEYTDVTWANDIKNLFEKYCDVHVDQHRKKRILSPIVTLGALALFPVAAGISLIFWENASVKSRVDTALHKSLEGIAPTDMMAVIDKKLDILLYGENTAKTFSDAIQPASALLAWMLLFAFIFIWIRNIPSSGIILSDEARKVYDRQEKRRTGSLRYVGLGTVVSIAVAVIANNVDRFLVDVF